MRGMAALAAAMAVISPPPALAQAQSAAPRPDDHAARNRIFVLTDIGNEPDDQMSFIRLLLYANEIDIEGVAAVTSQSLRTTTHPEMLARLVQAYGEVRPNLMRNAPGWPEAARLAAMITSGPKSDGLAGVDPAAPSAGAAALIAAADRPDPRPLWVSIWGGANTLAEALAIIRRTRSPAALDAFVARLRVYSISDQDDAGPWIRREFPKLSYIVSPSFDFGDFARATWTGISGDRFYGNDEGAADASEIGDAWLDANIRKGPLGTLYPHVQFIMEGDTPAFLNLVDNGLDSAQSPAWGGWGGRYVWRQPYGESRSIWTQGGFPAYGANSADQVIGVDGRQTRSDQATIWRWRDAFQNDFAARIDWTIKPPGEANHAPIVVVNGDASTGPILISARPGETITLDAASSHDPDRNQHVSFHWFQYREAGASLGPLGDVAIQRGDGPRATVTAGAPCRPMIPRVPAACSQGTAHVILAVTDDGTPSLTSYRRIVIRIAGDRPPNRRDRGSSLRER